MDEKEEVVLKKGNLVSAISQCPIIELYSTEYANLFLTPEQTDQFGAVTEVDLVTLVNTKAAYSFFLSEKEARKSLANSNQDLCKMKMDLNQGQEVALQSNGTFLTRKGDILYVSTCIPKTEQIKAGKCTQDIPIEGGFVDAQLKNFKKNSPPRPCEEELIIKAREAWINVGKTLERVPQPERFPATHENFKFYDFTGGIYTQMEVDNWKKAKEIAGLHKMMSTQIAHGVCGGEKLCEPQPHMTAYDISKIATDLTYMDPFHGIRETIKEWGAVLSLAVLAIEGLKFGAFLIMLVMTAINEGLNGLIALIIRVLCCSAVNGYRHIRNRRRRYEEKHGSGSQGPYEMNPTSPMLDTKGEC